MALACPGRPWFTVQLAPFKPPKAWSWWCEWSRGRSGECPHFLLAFVICSLCTYPFADGATVPNPFKVTNIWRLYTLFNISHKQCSCVSHPLPGWALAPTIMSHLVQRSVLRYFYYSDAHEQKFATLHLTPSLIPSSPRTCSPLSQHSTNLQVLYAI